MINRIMNKLVRKPANKVPMITEDPIENYLRNGRRPWSEGYFPFRQQQIAKVLADDSMMQLFRTDSFLPKEYGIYLDERMVEYPWFFSRLAAEPCRLLDAGSILNFDCIISQPLLQNKDITILTLEPEPYCFFQKKVSYQYGDIRMMPFRDNWFDIVVSISTIEHVGMDNSMYTGDKRFVENRKADYLQAVLELKRVTKKGGKIFISVPFGKHIHYGYYQQFSAKMVDAVLETLAPEKVRETYYAYAHDQWNVSTRDQCSDFEAFNIHDTKYFNPQSTKDYDADNAACSRAIAALECWV